MVTVRNVARDTRGESKTGSGQASLRETVP